MLAWRPGARSAVAARCTESSDAHDGAPLSPRSGRGCRRPGADLAMKIHLEKNLEEERQILLQQQKICRNRARKYFVESNRRKKAFEEKRKEQEEREQQIREQILQQRKEKFEEVTEKFQRAHIPLSQRRRAVFQKPVPPLEEALKQIQESNLKSEGNLPSSHRPTINWRAVDNALPSSLSKNGHKHQKLLLSKINCDKEMKENNRANMATNKDAFQLKLEETQKLLEDQHLSSLQKFRDEVNQITNSETLSSIDSLEAGEHEEIYLTINMEPFLSNQQNSVSLKSVNLQSTNLSCFDEDKLSLSKTQHINNWLINVNNPDTRSATPFSDILSKPNILPSHQRFNSKEQNPPVERVTNTNNSVAFVCSPPICVQDGKSKEVSETSSVRATHSSSGAFRRERPFVTESPTFKLSRFSNCSTPDSLTQETAASADQRGNFELAQENRTTSIPTSFVPMATPLVLPNKQSARPLPNSSLPIKEIDPVQCSDKLGELKNVKDEKIKYFNCNKKDLPLFSDDFQVAYIPHHSDSKEKKQKIVETSTSVSHVISNCDLVSQHKKMKYNIHERNGVRFLKSILKKESKYEHDCFKALVINRSFKLGNQRAAAIRDSIELTKEKGTEIPKTIKKLRWFDETGDTEKPAADNHSLKRTELSQQWCQPFHVQTGSGAASHVIDVAAGPVSSVEGTKPTEGSSSENVPALEPGTDHVPLNRLVPSGCNVAKQAWPASEKEESQAPLPSGDSTAQKAHPRRGGAKVIRRTRCAQVQSHLACATRKGTVVRPQSASRADAFLPAQGRLTVPHPPPKSPSNRRSGNNTQVSQCPSVTLENSQNVMTQNCFNSKPVLPTEHGLNQWNQESRFPLSDVCSDLATTMPSLPHCSSECPTLANINHSNGMQMVAQQGGRFHCTHRCPVYEESHHNVTLRTAKRESVPLRKRRNDILGQNAKTADSAIVRRKRIVENKQRRLLEQKRQNSGSVGQKYNEQMNNFGRSVQLSSREPKQTRGTSDAEEVSDSTSEFLMAENLVKASVPEDEILTVINSKPLQKSNVASNTTPPFNICALSADEQKILQSLSRLNERLY
ncbi:centrosomal protein of 126 kDa isoform X3 [Hyaena hyaena]|nr:centrosomal protein of 126 kDa isoform X3 [Hyaena hyaena]